MGGREWAGWSGVWGANGTTVIAKSINILKKYIYTIPIFLKKAVILQ